MRVRAEAAAKQARIQIRGRVRHRRSGCKTGQNSAAQEPRQAKKETSGRKTGENPAVGRGERRKGSPRGPKPLGGGPGGLDFGKKSAVGLQ